MGVREMDTEEIKRVFKLKYLYCGLVFESEDKICPICGSVAEEYREEYDLLIPQEVMEIWAEEWAFRDL